MAYCAALKEEKYRAQEAKNEERSNLDYENPIAKKEEDPAAKTFQKNTNSGWYTLYFAYDHAPICGTEFVIVAEYDGVFYVELRTGPLPAHLWISRRWKRLAVPCRITLWMESENNAVQTGIRKGPGDSRLTAAGSFSIKIACDEWYEFL